MQTAAAFRQRKCLGLLFQGRDKGKAHESRRTSNSFGSGYRRSFDSRVLLAIWFSGCDWTGGTKRRIANSTTVAARRRFRATRSRLLSTISWSQSMPEAQRLEHHVVLGRCRDSFPHCSISPSHRELGSWLNHASKSEIRALAVGPRSRIFCLLVFVGLEPESTGTATAHIAYVR